MAAIDNSRTDGEIVLEADQTIIKHSGTQLPEWVKVIDDRLKQRNNNKRI